MLAATAGATTRATLADLVERHITTLVRESAAVNRHSKRGGTVSAADDDDCADNGDDDDDAANEGGGGSGGNNHHKKRRTKRRMIHHDDVNMALLWRGSEKLYVSGVPLFSNHDNDDDDLPNSRGSGGIKPNNTIYNNTGLDRLLRSTTKTAADANDVITAILPSLLSSSIVPRVDLNAYLASELTIRPPCELKCTLHWLAVEGVQPMIPENQIWSEAYYNNNNNRRAGREGGGLRPALAPLATTTPSSLLLGLLENNNNNDDDNNGIDNDDTDTTYDKSSIRIRELQQRILSEELRLYYERVTSTIDKSNNNNNMSSSSSTKSQSQQLDADDATNTTTTTATISTVLHGLKYDFGLQELVPFLSRYIACGLLSLSTTTTTTTTTTKKANLRTATSTATSPPPSLTYCYRLIQVLDAMLGNTNLHLELHLHQLIVPIGTCIVARKLGGSTSSTANNNNNGGGGGKTRDNNDNSSSSSSSSNWYCDHWSLREEAARVLIKACTIYGTQYPTLTSRVIKLLTHQALRPDRPLVTQYGGIVGLSYLGPRIVDAFILPIAREYWERYEDERRKLVASCMGGSLGDAAATTTLGVATTTTTTKMKKRDIIERQYELTMCQVALLDAIQVFMMGVSPGEQSRRVDITIFADVFGERLIPMHPDLTVYTMAII